MMIVMMMMMMMKKEGEEKNYLPSGWPDPRSPRCRNCAQRIVTIQQKDPYHIQMIVFVPIWNIAFDPKYTKVVFLNMRNCSLSVFTVLLCATKNCNDPTKRSLHIQMIVFVPI